MKEKRIAIYGCGAMGTVLGAFLSRRGINLEMVDSYEEHVIALNEKGAKITGYVDFTTPVKAILPKQMSGIYDLIIFLCKQTANSQAFEAISEFVDMNSTILTLQNGVPEPSIAAVFGNKRVIGGTVLWGATFIGPGVSEVTQPLTPNKVFFEIGSIDGKISDKVKFAQEILGMIGTTHITTNLMGARMAKLAFNSSMSGMSAALCCPYGDILKNKKAMRIVGQIGDEVGQVTKAQGIKFEPYGGLHFDSFMKLGKVTRFIFRIAMSIAYHNKPTGKASMLQDLEKGKLTEVDLINGYICKLGDQFGIETPANDRIVEIVHGIEQKTKTMSFSNLELF
jgi:2-dehydropantoate 2-reductase